jgi:hypothetical protein
MVRAVFSARLHVFFLAGSDDCFVPVRGRRYEVFSRRFSLGFAPHCDDFAADVFAVGLDGVFEPEVLHCAGEGDLCTHVFVGADVMLPVPLETKLYSTRKRITENSCKG